MGGTLIRLFLVGLVLGVASMSSAGELVLNYPEDGDEVPDKFPITAMPGNWGYDQDLIIGMYVVNPNTGEQAFHEVMVRTRSAGSKPGPEPRVVPTAKNRQPTICC